MKLKNIIITIFFITVGFIKSELLNLVKINSKFALDKDQIRFEDQRNKVINYYETGDFEKQVTIICHKALKELLIVKKDNCVIIFDIDETALSNYPFFKEKNYIWSLNEEVVVFRQKMVCPVIQPVLEFYSELIKAGFKIIFLSSRRDSLYQATLKNLHNAGFAKFEELILLPMDLLNAGVKHGLWKAQKREELSKRYNIVGSISDSPKDFIGGNTGYNILFPNYLY